MSPNDARIRVFRTALGDLTTRPFPIAQLVAGDRIVMPVGNTVYEVTVDCAHNENGWLFVRDLSMTNAQAAAITAEPNTVEGGTDPRDGFFTYPPNTRMHLVVHDNGRKRRR